MTTETQTRSSAQQANLMRLYTASIDNEDSNEGEWNDLLYIVARTGSEAEELALRWLAGHRPDAQLLDPVEVHMYAGDSKVLTSFDPNEED